MANSTLSPGKPSNAIVKLREAALRDMDAPDLNVHSVRIPDFDNSHDGDNVERESEFPVIGAVTNPHVGNGRGPIG